MGRGIMIIGESGTGKSTAMETLDPKSTFILNVKGKSFPWKGWKSNYTQLTKENPTGNCFTTDQASEVIRTLQHISDKMPHVKTIVIDDFQYIAAAEFMAKIAEVGFTKFNVMGKNVYTLADMPRLLRDDLNIYYLNHSEEMEATMGVKRYKAKTLGKLIDNIVTLEGLFTVVLFTSIEKGKEGNSYGFVTQNDGTTTAKSPKGMFPTLRIPNDLALVNKAIEDYEK